ESQENVGSTFLVSLLLPVGSLKKSEKKKIIEAKLSGRCALVVDDNIQNIRVLELYLANWGMTTYSYSDPERAIEQCMNNTMYDIGFLDFQMPGLDGLELARKIRTKTSADLLPLVCLTSVSDLKVEDDQTFPFQAVLKKPIRASALKEALINVMGGSRRWKRITTSVTLNQQRLGDQFPLEILVAEDVPANQQVAQHLFKRLGYKVRFANNGQEAVDALKTSAYQMVFMDINMPVMDGEEACRVIRNEIPEDQQPWIVALTANALKGDRERFLAAGMNDYLSKPVKLEVLERCLLRGISTLQGVEDAQSGIIPSSSDYGVDTDVLDSLNSDIGEEMLGEVCKEFLTTIESRLNQMLALFPGGDLTSLHHMASSLKSEFSSMGCKALENAMGELERWETLPDKNTADAWTAHLNDRLGAAIKFIHQYLGAKNLLKKSELS
ncbi:MAG: response regulator, partial [Verrucomicrobiota bacterium]